ncbi:MAG: C40 family peptidase [Oscillospiraceae bacterium]|nr:C40 family peptidase [Oscillospiraceae bacterium]
MKNYKRLICLVLVLITLVSTISITAAARGDIKYGIAFITGSGLRLRSRATTSSSVLDSASKGEVAVVVSRSGEWYKVIYNLQEGYMHSDYLSILTRENAELGYGKVNGSAVNLRSGPSTAYKAVARADKGDKAYIIGMNDGWYKVIYGENVCYIRSDYLDLTEIPYENKDSAKSPIFFRNGKTTGIAVSASALKAAQDPDYKEEEEEENTLGKRIVAVAESCLGIPYVWGGESPSGFDCSGLVYYTLKTLGYSPYRTATTQYKMGTYVSKDNLQPGDLVFFAGTYASGISHVGIYVGDGQFIHSPHSGDVVKYSDLSSGYYAEHYYGARRIG